VLANQQGALIRKLEPDIMKLMKHENGNHVIQKALEVARPQDVEFVITALRGKVRELACHSTACRVVQSAMKFDHARAMIIEEVLPNLLMLANDQYGNYVIQSILVKGVDGDRARVIDSLQGSIVHLSKQKHASNVIEKCVIHGTPQQRQKMEAEMLATGPDGNSFLCSMVADLYANYVVRKYYHDGEALSGARQGLC
jgi:mRNA-binding protein PUF3